MNIFYLDNDPRKCAEQHNDKHVVKMILEYAQLLSTAHRVLDGIPRSEISLAGRRRTVYDLNDARDGSLYRATHINHPSAIWCRLSTVNYDWLYVMWRELMDEYTYRYYKVHACEKLIKPLNRAPFNIASGEFTEPTPAMPDQYKVPGNSIQSYRNYYVGDKHEMSRWTDRTMPEWFADGINKKYDQDCYMFYNKLGRAISTSTIHI